MQVRQRADRYPHRLVHAQQPHFCLIYLALEYEVVHIGYGGYGGAVVHGVGLYHRRSHLHWHIQHQPRCGGAHKRVAPFGVGLGYTLLYNRIGILGGVQLGFGLRVLCGGGLILLSAYNLLLQQHCVALMFCARVLKVYLGCLYARECR